MFKLKGLLLTGLTTLSLATVAAPPHFYVQMQNLSDKNVTISFRKGNGNVALAPTLADDTILPTEWKSIAYGVEIVPLESTATFNIIFKGKESCNFNVGFFAPGHPRITTEGLGCLGSGYRVTNHGYTLLLYVTDIDLTKKRSL